MRLAGLRPAFDSGDLSFRGAVVTGRIATVRSESTT